jgi:hypothetical protein
MTAVGVRTGPVAARLDGTPADAYVDAQDTSANVPDGKLRVVVVAIIEVPDGPGLGRLALGADEARHLAALLLAAADR